MKRLIQKYWLVITWMISFGLYGQERTVIEFYAEVPSVSDFKIDLKSEMSDGVIVQADGWKILPGHEVKIELPHVPPRSQIVEVRLGFAWDGQVVTGTFEGWSQNRFKYKVFEEKIYPHETQKRIFPSMQARRYEFRVECNFSLRPEQPSLILQSLVIYWDSEKDEN